MISREQKRMKEDQDNAMTEVKTELKDQMEEINILNARYSRALKDKVSVYDELVKSVT